MFTSKKSPSGGAVKNKKGGNPKTVPPAHYSVVLPCLNFDFLSRRVILEHPEYLFLSELGEIHPQQLRDHLAFGDPEPFGEQFKLSCNRCINTEGLSRFHLSKLLCLNKKNHPDNPSGLDFVLPPYFIIRMKSIFLRLKSKIIASSYKKLGVQKMSSVTIL